MNNDLIERYIYAVTRHLPRKQREDVSQELRTLIDDMLMERCGETAPTEKDVRIVLIELGSPQELYAKYDDSAEKCLIGQPYYSTYLYVMKVVVIAVTIGMAFANLILQMIEGQGWFEAVTGWLAMTYNSLLAAFAIVTLLFAFFYHKGIRISEPFNFDDLPPVPKKSQEVSRWENIAGIVFCLLFAIIFLLAPEVLCVFIEGTPVSLFEITTIRETWFIIVAFTACGIIREAVQLTEGRYNKKVMTTALITNGISAVLCAWWLLGFDLINQTFLTNMETICEGENAIVITMLAQLDVFFLGVMIFALVLDTIEVTVKALRK